MQRGDIFIATIAPRSGSEQSGTRPVLIISHDGFNHTSNWNSIIIIPLTTALQPLKRAPTIVHLSQNYGVQKDSMILCHQITTIDKSKLGNKIGTITQEKMIDVEKAIQYALGIM